MSKRKRSDSTRTQSTATSSSPPSRPSAPPSPPSPSAAAASKNDAWWARAVTHTLDTAEELAQLGLDMKKRLKNVLHDALDTAAKYACTDLSNAGREGASDNVDGDGREGGEDDDAREGDRGSSLNLDPAWADQDFRGCDSPDDDVRRGAAMDLFSALMASAPQELNHHFGFREGKNVLGLKIRELLLADSFQAVQSEIVDAENKLANAHLYDNTPAQRPLQIWLDLVRQRQAMMLSHKPTSQERNPAGRCDWCLGMKCHKKMTGIKCWKHSVKLQNQINEITDEDISDATFRLGKDPAYVQHTRECHTKDTPDHAHELTGRQARVVLFYKVYHFFWGKEPPEEDRERKKFCACVEAMVRDRHPDDENDVRVLKNRDQGDYSYREWT